MLSTPPDRGIKRKHIRLISGVNHHVGFAKDGDFMIDGRYLFEVGGKGKGFAQIRNIPDSYVAADDIEFGFGNKIPLWLFGLLY